MGLDDVVQEVRTGSERQAKEILDAAQAEADTILADARAKAAHYETERLAQAERDVEQLERQAISHARFEARKAVLATENELRDELRRHIMDGLAGLDAKTRKAHIKTLTKTAQAIIPSGRVWGAAADAAALKEGAYEYAGEADIAGGLIVESDDGKERLDLSYETLLGDVWRDVLAAEAGLFE